MLACLLAYLTVPLLSVLQSVKFVWQRQETLRQHGPARDVHGQLPLVGSFHCALRADQVTRVGPRLDVLQSARSRMNNKKIIKKRSKGGKAEIRAKLMVLLETNILKK